MPPLIETENLCRFFQQSDDIVVKAVDDVSIAIEPGEFTAIIGPSGSGKTTLLHLIGGLDEATSGDIRLNGISTRGMSATQLSDFRRDHIGFVFQAYNLIPVLSAQENIEYVMLLQGMDAPTRQQRVAKTLEQVGLSEYADRRPGNLSGGQQQRVAIARAMAAEPDLILADEPTANLDSKTGIALLEVMKSLNESLGTTFVFSTHDDKIMQRARRLIHIEDGKIVKDERKPD